MPNAKISQLTAASTPLTGTELVPVVQGGVTKSVSAEDIVKSTIPSGTANGVLYLNGSKVATSSSALTFDGVNFKVNATGVFQVGNSAATDRLNVSPNIPGSGATIYSTNFAGSAYSPLVFDANQFVFRPNGNEAMRLTSTGLGIGTSSPGAKLDVVGQGQFRPFGNTLGASDWFAIGSIQEASNYGVGIGLYVENAVGNAYAMTFGTKPNSVAPITERMRLDSSGNLGLGVTPSAWVANAKAVQIGSFAAVWTGSNGSANVGFGAYEGGVNTYNYITTGDFPTMYQQLTGAHKWFTAPSGAAGNAISFTQAMTLDASGNLLVNTTNKTTIAAGGVVIGNLNNAIGGANSGGILTMSGVTTTSYVGLFSNPNGAVGSITISGSTTAYNTSSDYRLKDITGPVTNSGTYIDSLNPVEGTWKADGSTFVGLIAHEVQEVSRTNVVTGVKDGEQMQAMDYSSAELIANLIAEVKSLRARVAALEAA